MHATPWILSWLLLSTLPGLPQSPLPDDFNPGANGTVVTLAVQADGKILMGGEFTSMGGQSLAYLARLNANGTVDEGFNPGVGGQVWSLVVQVDDKILIGGAFTAVGGSTRKHLARLNPDGTLDDGFNPGANSDVYSLVVLQDGSVVAGGHFTFLADQRRDRIARLNPDGTLDSGFNPGANEPVRSLAMQVDGKILIGGQFSVLGTQPRANIARLDVTGALDNSFDPGANGNVCSLVVQPDGKIVVGGNFTAVKGQTRNRIARLNADGTIDPDFNTGFNSGVFGGEVWSLSLQTDGQLVVGGYFTNVAGEVRSRVARLNADGTLDNGFDPGADSTVASLALQEDGKILVGGYFSRIAGQPRSRIARLNNSGPATQDLTRDGPTITWFRTGTSPEVWRTTFEHTSDGVTWASFGDGTRILGGWKSGGAPISPGGTVRVRGHVTGGQQNASGWFVESIIGAPILLTQPRSRTNHLGTTATFDALAAGSGSLAYQWFKDGVALADGSNISGATESTLTVSVVSGADRGDYSVTVANAEGTVTSQAATLTVLDPMITAQPFSLERNLDGIATFDVMATGTALSYQWWKDGVILADATSMSLTLTNLQPDDAGTYWVVVSNPYGSTTSTVAVLALDDNRFNPDPGDYVYALAVQSDGKVLLGGSFRSLDGQERNRIGRLNANGTLDSEFNPGADGSVESLAVQADGKILVAGNFSEVGNRARRGFTRLSEDGTVDDAFNPGTVGPTFSILVQPDGKILAGGSFTAFGGQPRSRLARVSADGALDAGFDPGADGTVRAVALQTDGKILVGGQFRVLAGQSRDCVGRLNKDGTLDSEFKPVVRGPGLFAEVFALVVQPDAKILVAGYFETLDGQPRGSVCRLNAEGTLDTDFNPEANGTVYSLAIQADGKVLMAGSFTSVAGQPRNRIARVEPDGTLDDSFNPGADRWVGSVAVQTDGRILVVGSFDTLGGRPHKYVGRLVNNGPATQRLSFDGSTISWLRGGTGPEVSSTSFDHSGDGHTWTSLGTGMRIPGGWEITGIAAPPGVTIRARGPVAQGGGVNGGASGWSVETMVPNPAPGFLAQPVSRTNYAGTLANFTVTCGGPGPLAFQWFRDAIATVDGGRVLGSATSTLMITDTLKSDEGSYRVAISNGAGSVASDVATLIVIDKPIILTEPTGLTVNAELSAVFGVTAIGPEPLFYQWRKDGVALADGRHVSGAKTPTMTVSDLLKVDQGDYYAVVDNQFGSTTSLVARLTVVDPLITRQPLSQERDAGQDVAFTVEAAGTDLGFQWFKEVDALAQGTGPALTLANLQASDAGSYRVVVSNQYGSVTSVAVELKVNLATTEGGFDPQANHEVYALAVQIDGKILVGRKFTSLGGQVRNHLGRLNVDGTLDASFNPGANDAVHAMLVQPDGKTIVGGVFTNLAGQVRSGIARLNADGTLDSVFNPRAKGSVQALALQPDGKILVGGSFTNLANQMRERVARLTATNGTPDSAFNSGANGLVNSLALQADGRILVGGEFTLVGGQPRNRIARWNANGTLDGEFNPDANGPVHSLAVMADGSILVGGAFTVLAGEARNHLGRLNADGTLDRGFDPSVDGLVSSLALQADGMILLAGSFATVRGAERRNIARLNSDGTPDDGFNPGAEGAVRTLAVQADGKVVVGGTFAALGGKARSSLGRLSNTDPASQSLSYQRSTTSWLRGGSGPEAWRTTFEHSTNGLIWTNLGAGTRTFGGWQLSGVALPPNGALRARGYVAGGGEGSGWLVEAMIGAPGISGHPYSVTNPAGTTAMFSVVVGGSGPLQYRWRKDGVPLVDGDNVSGSTISTLRLSNVLKADEGSYSVMVGNGEGNVTSFGATLKVLDPYLFVQPTNQSLEPGENGTFHVEAAGTPPLTYQWYRDGRPLVDGGNIAGATNATLQVGNVFKWDEGTFAAIISNNFGAVTSITARLAVNWTMLDLGFNPRANGDISSLAVQPDGKVLVGGSFTSVGGQARTNIGRLNDDGALDSEFNPGANGSVYSMAVQEDGRILLAGNFSSVAGQTRNRIARIEPDGTVDAGFNAGADREVYSMALQADGGILVGGEFAALGGLSRARIARVSADGMLDMGFDPGANNSVYSLAVQADGKILVGGWFTELAGRARNRIARVNADGTLDSGFDPGASDAVYSLAIQADGRILVGGAFRTIGGQARNRIARLNADGTLDDNFDPDASGAVFSLALQADGRILVGGEFRSLGGLTFNCFARLNADGTVDSWFNPGAEGGSYPHVYALGVQADGRILVGGGFSTLAGEARTNIARLNNTETATQSLSVDGPTITWLRGGTSPEVWRTTFEHKPNGLEWTGLGGGARIPGGWRLTGTSALSSVTLRARGHVAGGFEGSRWFIETLLNLDTQSNPEPELGISLSGAYPTLRVAGQVGLTYTIEHVPSLPAAGGWITLQTIVLTNNPGTILDTSFSGSSNRFYRARFVP